MTKRLTLERAFFILFGLILLFQLFIPPIVGLADNGDFARIMEKVGIQQGQNKEFLGNINLTFPISFNYNIKGYQSSELIFVLTAILINAITSKDGLFHLLTLGAVHTVALLAALGVVIYGLSTASKRSKWVVYACILLFFTDVGYVSYLNSIYSEPASLIFLALTLGIVLVIVGRIDHQPLGFGWAVAYFMAAFLFIIAKPQNAAMGIPLALLGFLLVKRSQIPKFFGRRTGYLPWMLSVGLAAASFLFFAFGLPRYYRSGDLWNSIFLEIVGNSKNPAQDLAELGLPPEMIIYKGKYAFSEGVNRNDYEVFQHSWLYFKIFKFYLVHPDRLLNLMENTTSSTFQLQPPNLGNFVSSETFGSYDKSQAFTIWNRLRSALLPASIWTLAGLLVINLASVVIKLKLFDQQFSQRLVSALHITIILMAILQYFTVLMAEGTFELVKHMFLFNVLLDVTFIFLFTYLVGAAGMLIRRISPRPQVSG